MKRKPKHKCLDCVTMEEWDKASASVMKKNKRKPNKFVWGGEWDGGYFIRWDGMGLSPITNLSSRKITCEAGATLSKMLGKEPRRAKVEVTWK